MVIDCDGEVVIVEEVFDPVVVAVDTSSSWLKHHPALVWGSDCFRLLASTGLHASLSSAWHAMRRIFYTTPAHILLVVCDVCCAWCLYVPYRCAAIHAMELLINMKCTSSRALNVHVHTLVRCRGTCTCICTVTRLHV